MRRAPYIYAGASQEAAPQGAGLQVVENAILICLLGQVVLFDRLEALRSAC